MAAEAEAQMNSAEAGTATLRCSPDLERKRHRGAGGECEELRVGKGMMG